MTTDTQFDALVFSDIRALIEAGRVEELRIQAAEAYEAHLEADREADLAMVRAHDAERAWRKAQDAYEAAAKARREGDK